jgi:hypothetical protein
MENPVYYQIVMTDQAALIQDLFSEETASLQGVMETVRLTDGELLFSRGDSGDAFYIIETGHIRIFTLAEEDSPSILWDRARSSAKWPWWTTNPAPPAPLL